MIWSLTIVLLADVHAHLDIFGEEKRKAAVERAAAAGVKAIINNSVDAASMRKSLDQNCCNWGDWAGLSGNSRRYRKGKAAAAAKKCFCTPFTAV